MYYHFFNVQLGKRRSPYNTCCAAEISCCVEANKDLLENTNTARGEESDMMPSGA